MRPFRDVLLGLFFVGIGMLIDPASIPRILHWALLGAVLILASKTLLVTAMVGMSGIATFTAWRTVLIGGFGRVGHIWLRSADRRMRR